MLDQVWPAIYLGHVKFFRNQLLNSNSEQIPKLVEALDRECEGIREEALRLSWYMRGGLTYDQAMGLSPQERKLINALIKENLETTKKSGLPFY